ncbi:hypothetical protein GCM10007919_14950 [Rhizobium indigoferae]|nr:hypothetical protein GCM10007919_14950 [Rhizobium indigoferae]
MGCRHFHRAARVLRWQFPFADLINHPHDAQDFSHVDAERHRSYHFGIGHALNLERELTPGEVQCQRQAESVSKPFDGKDNTLAGLPVLVEKLGGERDGVQRLRPRQTG